MTHEHIGHFNNLLGAIRSSADHYLDGQEIEAAAYDFYHDSDDIPGYAAEEGLQDDEIQGALEELITMIYADRWAQRQQADKEHAEIEATDRIEDARITTGIGRQLARMSRRAG